MFGGDKGKTRRVHTLQTDVAALQAALEAAKAEYDRVLDRNLKVHCACQIDISSQGCASGLCLGIAASKRAFMRLPCPLTMPAPSKDERRRVLLSAWRGQRA